MAAHSGFAHFVRDDHRYVFLGTSAIAVVGLWLANQPHSPSSFLLRSYAAEALLYYILLAWLAVSAAAFVNKLVRWKGTAYAETSPFTKPAAKKAERIGSYAIFAIVCVFIADRGIVGLYDLVTSAISQDANPSDFLGSMIYMLYKMGGTFVQGIVNTIIIAVVGTVVAFFLALVLVFLRLQEIDRSDNDFIRFLKVVGVGFAKIYSAVMRGTPMMIQGLIIYYAGTGLLTAQGMTPTQILGVWSPFNAGLVTVSLNSTAYMMEVLRSGILAVDPGQTEAARSLGMSQWQAMRKVVFPQGIKNAIPRPLERARHQHQGLLGAHGDRRPRADLCGPHHRRRLLQADGALCGCSRGLPDPHHDRDQAAEQVRPAFRCQGKPGRARHLGCAGRKARGA